MATVTFVIYTFIASIWWLLSKPWFHKRRIEAELSCHSLALTNQPATQPIPIHNFLDAVKHNMNLTDSHDEENWRFLLFFIID